MGWRCKSLGIWFSGDGMFWGCYGIGARVFGYDCLVMGCSRDVMGWRYLSLGIWLSGDGMCWRCYGMEMHESWYMVVW